jgi:multiple sugar transport system ATP-binding protein
MTTVELKDLYKEYETGKPVIQDLNLTVIPGELLVLVGPSGCGKSTVLRMIAGLEDISGGSLFFDGVCINDMPAKMRDIGMVFQNYALYPHLTVAENLGFPLSLRKFPKGEILKKVQEIAEQVGLSDLLYRKPKQLSGGQRQRVALGRAIIRTPRVFLFDEPLSNLDAQLRMHMRSEIVALQKRVGITGIYVTHDQAEAMTMGDRIAVLHKGILQQIGKPQDIYNNPQNVFVAGFLGSPSMNFFHGSFTKINNELIFQELHNGASFTIPDHSFIYGIPDNNNIIVGIRPEKLSLTPLENAPTWQCSIHQTEYHGHEQIAFVQSADSLKSIRVPLQFPVKNDDAIKLYIQPDSLCIFSSLTHNRL